MPNFFVADKIKRLLDSALQSGNPQALEDHLIEQGDRGQNLELATAFASRIGQIVTLPNPPVERLEELLDGWAALPFASDFTNVELLILPVAAALSYGRVAVVRPDWWDDEIRKLHLLASAPFQEVRQTVVMALKAVLKVDGERTRQELTSWAQAAEAQTAAIAYAVLTQASTEQR